VIRTFLHRAAGSLRALVRRRHVEAELNDELQAYLAASVDEKIRAGMPPDAATRAARVEIGSIEAVKDYTRDAGWESLFETLAHDLRYALRTFRRSPGFAAVAILTLALGIGANTAIFSVVNSVLLRPLPYPDSDRLVRIIETTAPVADAGVPQFPGGLNAIELETLRARSQTLTHIGIHRDAAVILTGTETTRLQGQRVSPEVFASLGIQPFLGRTFGPREEDDALIVLAHAAWRRYFGADPGVLGRSIALNGTPYSVVGVMPPEFQFPDPTPQFWAPTPLPAGRLAVLQRMVPLARVRPDVPIETVSAEVTAIVHGVRQATPPEGVSSRSGEFHVMPLQDDVVAPVRPALLVLTVAVGFVLLIACVNVANLLLARGAARQQEIALRLALGARRGRLVRQLLTESTLLALTGGAAGTALAVAGIRLLRTLGTSLPRQDLVAPPSLPRLADVAIDGRALAFTLAVSLITAVVFGLAPAVYQSRRARMRALRAGLAYSSTQRTLVVAELAIATMLLVGGGLLMHSFVKLSSVNPGYNSVNVLTFTLVTPPRRYSGPQLARLADDVVSRLQDVPGVHAAGYTELLPMVRFRTSGRIAPASQSPAQPPPSLDSSADPGQPDTFTVSQHFLDVMGIRVIEGRGFDDNDSAGQPGVVLINRTLARSGFLGTDPLGKRISALKQTWEIVGIVDDVQQFGLDQDPVPQVFFEMRQTPAPGITARVNYFAIRTDGEPGAVVPTIRRIVGQLDAEATIDLVAPMEQLVSNSISRPRLYATLLGIFAVVAAALAAIGMYGVMAYSVAQRTREIGIRMALGARPGAVMHLVVREGLVLTAVGLGIGLAAAMMATRYLEGLLFGLTPLDPTTFLAVSVMFAIVATVASYLPARRATCVDPLVALRYE
jgi:putative ABC transport system permease protein